MFNAPAVRELVIVADLRTSNDPVKEEEVVVALMENILDILATTPDEEAISKYASGVVSPSPNLPREVEEKTANLSPVSSETSKSAEKEAPFLNSHCLMIVCSVDLEAGPLR